MIAGDLNAKHTAWNCRQNNNYGATLFNLRMKRNIEVHYSDSPTLFPLHSGLPSTADLVLNKNVIYVSKPKVIEDLNSDHYPIMFKFYSGVKRLPPSTIQDYILKPTGRY